MDEAWISRSGAAARAGEGAGLARAVTLSVLFALTAASCQFATPCSATAPCPGVAQCVAGACVLRSGGPDAGPVDAGRLDAGTPSDAGVDAGAPTDAGCTVELHVQSGPSRAWDAPLELETVSNCEPVVTPKVRFRDGGVVEVRAHPCSQCALSVCHCFAALPWTGELPGPNGVLDVVAGDAGAEVPVTRVRWTAQVTGQLVAQPVISAEGDLVLGVRDNLGVAMWRLRTLADGGLSSDLRQPESFDTLTELIATPEGVTAGYGQAGVLFGVWTDSREAQRFDELDARNEVAAREWTALPGGEVALAFGAGLRAVAADGGVRTIPLQLGESRQPTGVAYASGATVFAQYDGPAGAAIIRFDADAGVSLPAVETQHAAFDVLLPHPTLPFPAVFGVNDAGLSSAVGGEGRQVLATVGPTPAVSLLDDTRLVATQPGRAVEVLRVEAPLSVFGGSAVVVASAPLESHERPVTPLLGAGRGADWVYVWSGTLHAVALARDGGTSTLRDAWTATPLPGELVPAELALDCPRGDAADGAPGVLYVAAEDPDAGVVRVAALLVEAQRLTGAWPKYRRTSSNAGNLQAPLHQGCR